MLFPNKLPLENIMFFNSKRFFSDPNLEMTIFFKPQVDVLISLPIGLLQKR